MRVLKTPLFLILPVIFIVTVFANPEKLSTYRTPHVTSSTEQMATLEGPKKNTDKNLHQKLILTALFDERPEVRVKAE